jgi:hypothetical protein
MIPDGIFHNRRCDLVRLIHDGAVTDIRNAIIWIVDGIVDIAVYGENLPITTIVNPEYIKIHRDEGQELCLIISTEHERSE